MQMKLKKFFPRHDLDFLLDSIFGCPEPRRLIDIARSASSRLDFPLFQASIGQGDTPFIVGDNPLTSAHMITWFRQSAAKERIVTGYPTAHPLSSYYLGLWYAYGWRRPDSEMQRMLDDLSSIGQIHTRNSWAWIIMDPGTTFDLGVFYAVFGE